MLVIERVCVVYGLIHWYDLHKGKKERKKEGRKHRTRALQVVRCPTLTLVGNSSKTCPERFATSLNKPVRQRNLQGEKGCTTSLLEPIRLTQRNASKTSP